MSKKITFAAKPQAGPLPTADDWVRSQDAAATNAATNTNGEIIGGAALNEPMEPMKRLTIDIPAPLHAQIKSQCALRSTKMADEIRILLEQHFATE